MTGWTRSRTDARKGYTDSLIRVQLLEEDADHFEKGIESLRKELAGQTKILVGILITTVTASLMLTANVIILGSP